MRKINYLLLIVFLIGLSSCAQKVPFQISDLAPAAEAHAKIKKDKNENYNVEVEAKYLTAPDRLSPPKNFYIVWIETENGATKSVGQLVSQTSKNASIEFVTAARPKLIFVTAEDSANTNIPSSHVVLRTNVFEVD